jgi:hypothetical protein
MVRYGRVTAAGVVVSLFGNIIIAVNPTVSYILQCIECTSTHSPSYVAHFTIMQPQRKEEKSVVRGHESSYVAVSCEHIVGPRNSTNADG